MALLSNPNIERYMDIRVAAVRENERVGNGSCTSIDECWGDAELIKEFDENGITTPGAAVRWAIETEGLYLEQGLNQRWGESDDPQLLAYREFKERGD